MRASSQLIALNVILVAAMLGPSPALGQWTVAVEVGADRFWGGSLENAPERRSFRPYRPTTFGAGLERRSGRLGGGLLLHYTEAGLGLEGNDAVAAAKGVFTVYSASPELSYRLVSVGADNALLLHAGPLFEIWSVADENPRTRVGAQGSVSLGVPLGGKFAASFSAGAALTSSPFAAGELVGYNLRALWRRRFAAGLRYQL